MNIRIMLLFICSLFMIITSMDATEVLSSDKVHVKDLAKRFAKLLESEIQTCVKTVSKGCKKEPVLKQLNTVQTTLNEFEFELTDCFTNSQEYTGKRNTTKSGLVCQNWSSHVPHEHTYTNFPDGSGDKAGNYCRDPVGDGIPWCFTVDPKMRHEDCSVPRCDTF